MNASQFPKAVINLEWRLLRLPYTLFEAVKARSVEPQTRQEEARRAFMEEFVGRAQGIAGFVMGDDDLIAQGQIERAKGALRMEALTSESIAELRERAADKALGEERAEASEQRRRVARQEAQRKTRVAQEASLRKAEVARRASEQREAAHLQAEEKRIALEDAEGLVDREYAIHLGDAEMLEQTAEDAKLDAEILEGARKGRKD